MEDTVIDPLLINHEIVGSIFQPLSWELVLSLLIFIILLFFSAVISGSEIAYFALSPVDEDKLSSDKSRNAKLIQQLLLKPKKLLATILITNNFVNVGIVILSTYIVAQMFDFSAFPFIGMLIQVVVVTALILLIGEIIPKIYSTKKTLSFAFFMVRPLIILNRFLQPLSYFLVKSSTIIDKRLAKKAADITMQDLSEAIDITTRGQHSEEETRLLKGIAQFTDIGASEIMKSRLDVVAVDITIPFQDLLKVILDSAFSRIPVYEDSFDNVQGILYIKDLLPFLNKQDEFSWPNLIRPAIFIPENKKINDLLQEFREKKIHLAIVVDEYGGTSGIITLEDILEEIVGEITDEFDEAADDIQYKKIQEGHYIFEGRTPMNDFCKVVKIPYDYFDEIKGESDSMAGLVLELTEQLPEKGEQVAFGDFTFTVIDADNRRIKKIKVVQKSI